MKRIKNNFAFLVMGVVVMTSCEKFLDEKPDKKLVTPTSMQDLQRLLDNEGVFNTGFPSAGEIACDNYYLTSIDWTNLTSAITRETYTWEPLVDFETDWTNSYQKIFYSNVVLDNIDKVSNEERLDYNSIKGSALFFRAITFFKAAQVYTVPYSDNIPATQPGLPLILSSDINTENIRASLNETYQRIVTDLIEASTLLPELSSPVTRPNKAAAYGLLAYTYLILHEYENANKYADSSLAIKDDLIDYNSIPITTNPFQRFNTEVLFQARTSSAVALAPARCKVDSALYNSYSDSDLRKTLFYRSNNNGTYAFKGSYDANPNGSNFYSGITVDEMYLLKAESLARLNRTTEALFWLNKLLITRWRLNTFVEYTANSPEAAVDIILRERRKELVFRGGIRWTDIRRLNNEASRATTLKRVLNGTEYTLPPGDLRFAFLIPNSVMQLSNIEQNKR